MNFLYFVITLIAVQSVLAEAPSADKNTSESKKNYSLNVSGLISYYRYVEPGLISHLGILTGARGELTWKINPSWQGVASASLLAGRLVYDGSLCDVNTSVCSGFKGNTNDLIFRGTHRFDYKVNSEVSLFIGPGMRYLIDRGESAGFYTRQGLYLFAPIGFSYETSVQNNRFVFDFEYDYFIQGSMISRVSEVNSTYTDMKHKQSSGFGHKISLSWLDVLSEALVSQQAHFDLFLAYENWQIEASDKQPLYVNGVASKYYIEPKNFTESWTAGASIRF